jgi:hypothetical protein
VQSVTARDYDLTCRAARQQGVHLVAVTGIVQDDQHPPPGHQAPVEGDLPIELGGPRVRWHAQRIQEPANRLARLDRRTHGVEPTEIDIQLTVWESLGTLVPPVDRQRRLADTGHALDDRDADSLAVDHHGIERPPPP